MLKNKNGVLVELFRKKITLYHIMVNGNQLTNNVRKMQNMKN